MTGAVETALRAQLDRALRYRGGYPANWVEPEPGTDHDVLIVGGGQNAMALTLALRNFGVHRVIAVDDKPEGQAGIWHDTARMRTLRTPKTLTGPDLGFAPLAYPTWHDAHFGPGSFDAVGLIGRVEWGDYLDWFRRAAAIAVRHDTRVAAILPEGRHLRVQLEGDGRTWTEVARKVVFANGIGGLGAPALPAFLPAALPAAFYGHSADRLDVARLRGRVVGVIGAAASAFDAAAAALEAGAAEVHLFCRKPKIPTLQINRSRAYPGALDHFHSLPDALRWMLFNRVHRSGTPPPAESVRRVLAFPNIRLHTGRDLDGLDLDGGRIRLPFDGPALDFIIAGTGYAQDLALRPELAAVAPVIATWRDRHRPASDEVNEALSRYPYLGAAFEVLPKDPAETRPWLANLHAFTPAAGLSFGRFVGDVPSMKFAVTQLSRAIFADLFHQNATSHEARMRIIPADREFDDSLYAPLLQGAPA